jgi:hypothetical protein
MTYPYHHDANKRKLVAPGTKLRKRDVNDAHMRTLRGDDGVPHVRQAPPIGQSCRSLPSSMRAQDRDPCTVPGLILVGEYQGRFFLSFFSTFFLHRGRAGPQSYVTADYDTSCTNKPSSDKGEEGGGRLVIISRLTSGVTTMSRLLGRATVRLGRLDPSGHIVAFALGFTSCD